MDIMENIGNFADKVEGDAEDFMQSTQTYTEAEPNRPANHQNYQDETFTYSISKQPKYKLADAPNKTSSKTISKKPSTKLNEDKNKNKTLVSTPNSTIGLK